MNNNELLEQAKAAKSPEEIKDLMSSNGIADLTDRTAQKYFDYLNMKSGELSDDELENAAGGCDTYGHPTVTCDRSCSCGRWEAIFDGEYMRRKDYANLRWLWYGNTIGENQTPNKCGTCLHLGFNSAGTGFCEVQ